MKSPVAAALAFLLAAPVQAQAPKTQRPVRGAVESVAAEVDALVLDRKNQPVAGLVKGDFKLFVNGTETTIDYVEAAPVPVVSARTPESTSTPEAAPAHVPTAGARRPHSTVLIFDDLHTGFGARFKGITGLRKHLATLPESEEVAVYSLNFSLRTLQPFTRDRALVRRALDAAGRTMPVSQIDFPTADEYINRSRQALRSFADLFRALASRSEPKTVVLLAGALPAWGEANAALRGSVDIARSSSFGSFASFAPPGSSRALVAAKVGPSKYAYSYVDNARDMANEALLARATVIALDPAGLEAPGEGADSQKPNEARVDSFAYLNDTFALLADDTGGARVGFSNADGDRLIAESDRLNLRYRLGFTPPDSTSDRRDIRVEVLRPGVTVRVASGQRSLTAEAASRARFAAFLLRSDPARGDFPLTVEVKSPVAKRKSDAFTFDILIPLSGVFAESIVDMRRAHLELLIAGVDAEGRVGDLMVLPFEVEIAKDAPAGGFFRHHGDFQLDRKWKGRLFLGVRDLSTNQLGAATIPVG
ncbi:MAG: VWA domain-containing protein [Thermoanaerobaculia bacterium]|nr:VWA domain-containing protein [Thermoanaerobaculia bacterium]